MIKMSLPKLFSSLFIALCLLQNVRTDLPVHCHSNKMVGEWTFYIQNVQFLASLHNPKSTCTHGFPDQVDDSNSDLSYHFKNYRKVQLDLKADHSVADLNGSPIGTWTAVYDEGFIINTGAEIYTAFMKYYKNSSTGKYTSDCSKTMIAWYLPDQKYPRNNWSCFFGEKGDGSNYNAKPKLRKEIKSNKFLKPNLGVSLLQVRDKVTTLRKIFENLNKKNLENYKFDQQQNVINEINNLKLPWKAHIYEEFKGYNFLELKQKLGLVKKTSPHSNFPSKENSQHSANFFSFLQTHQNKLSTQDSLSSVESTTFVEKSKKTDDDDDDDEEKQDPDSEDVKSYEEVSKYLNSDLNEINVEKLPKNWDWTNVGGVSYVTKPRQQGSCGSCYIFSSMGSLESRLRVLTNNKDKTVFSRQFPISCNFYTEGCAGGYPVLVGKFSHEFELLPESCFPYEAKDAPCSKVCDYSKFKKRYFAKHYGYIGGFYGATTEEAMLKELRARGPIPGNISVPWSFPYYKKGIYSENGLMKNAGNISHTSIFDDKIMWERVDHSTLIVGYGEENGIKYWKCLNTWGAHWGESGFYKILRGENECNIESMGDYFTVGYENRNNE